MTVSNVNVSAATLGTYIYTATGGETSKSGPDDNGATLSYTPGKELVHVNGVLLVKTSDYTATDGSSITLVNALVAGDVLEVISFSPFSVANAIPSTVVTAKGDLIAASSSGTVTNLAVGADGTTLVADSSTSTGLRYTALFGANKNKILNGDFLINQRAFTSATTSGYTFDRWRFGTVGGTCTATPQVFTLGTAPVAGYEGTNFLQIVTSGQSATSDLTYETQRIEDVRTFANQTITVSFWAKANTGTPKIAVGYTQNFGTAGSGGVSGAINQSTISTSWARYSVTATIPSISGKTIGASSYLELEFWVSAGSDYNARTGSLGIQSNTFQIWGVQAEAGSVATPFTTATGTVQGELTACQRYYRRFTTNSLYAAISPIGTAANVNLVYIPFAFGNPMRSTTYTLDTGGSLAVGDGTNSVTSITSFGISSDSSTNLAVLTAAKTAGFVSFRPYYIQAFNDAAAYVGIGSEL